MCRIFWSKVEEFYNVQTGSDIPLREKDVLIFHENSTSEHRKSYILNLLILYGKYYIHKCKWNQKPPKIQPFIKEVEFYMISLHGVKDKKAMKTLDICESFNMFN